MHTIELEDFLPYRMNRIAAAISRRFRTIYRDQARLTIPEWRVLATLAQFGTGTAGWIGRHSDMHKTKVSRAVRGLEQRLWLKRRPSPADGREELLALTPAGGRAYAEIVPKMLALERELLDRLPPQTAQALLDALPALERLLGLESSHGEGGVHDRPPERR